MSMLWLGGIQKYIGEKLLHQLPLIFRISAKGVRWYSRPIFSVLFSEKRCLDGTARFLKKLTFIWVLIYKFWKRLTFGEFKSEAVTYLSV